MNSNYIILGITFVAALATIIGLVLFYNKQMSEQRRLIIKVFIARYKNNNSDELCDMLSNPMVGELALQQCSEMFIERLRTSGSLRDFSREIDAIKLSSRRVQSRVKESLPTLVIDQFIKSIQQGIPVDPQTRTLLEHVLEQQEKFTYISRQQTMVIEKAIAESAAAKCLNTID